ncbi:DNA repair protein rad18 [Xylaria palmicola]|nr:DNA repair protein rad18 [Xylaria palmicola]
MNPDGFDGVADSTDWLATPLSGLAAVEAALRCQICKDFYRTPMLTSCNHTFCSLCIRRALSADGRCPLCRASEQEMKLRSNWSMEEVVAAFTHARAAVLDFARRPPPAPARAETPKRKADDGEDGDGLEASSSQQRSSKRLRSSARLSKTRGIEVTAEMAWQEAHSSDLELSNPEPDDGLVACPICWRRMKPLQVDRHIDTSCPGEPQPDPPPPAKPSRRGPSKPTGIASVFAPPSSSSSSASPSTFSSTFSSSSKPQPRPERLPALNYSMLREAQLRRELADLGLTTGGNRGLLERRHREWVMMWNANCDSQRPRRRAELLHELDVWERTLGSRAPAASSSSTTAGGGSRGGGGAQIRDKDFDGAAWAAKHDASFRDLIASARRTRAQAQRQSQTPEEGGGEEAGGGVNGTPPAKPTVETPEIIDVDAIGGDSKDTGDPPSSIKRLEREPESKSLPTI